MVGLIGKKMGMTQIFDDQGNAVPVTVIKIEKNVVVNKRTVEKNGYNALVLGVEDMKEKRTIKPYKGQFTDGVTPKRVLKEFRVDSLPEIEVGGVYDVESLNDVKYVDISGVSKGKGFQGVMKRYGFHGGPASHGSKFKRDHGSTGQNTYPGHCFKGVKRAGRMGFDNVTIQNLKIVKIDKDNSVLLVEGSIPGNKKTVVFVNKSCKKK